MACPQPESSSEGDLPPAPAPALRPAGLLRRLLATLLDMVVFVGLSVLLGWPLARAVDWSAAVSSYHSFTEVITEPQWSSHALGVLGLWTALWWAYFVVGWGLAGASPGKMLLGLRVVDYRQQYPIGAARAALRLIAYMVSAISLGHVLVLLRSDRRALHDILAGTQVVRRPPAGGQRGGATTQKVGGSASTPPR